MLPVPGKIFVHIPSSLCVHLLSARNNSRNNKWALGLGALFFEVECFFFVCFKTSGLKLTSPFLYSEYERLSYSSLHLGKMHVFGPCTYLSNRHEKA